MSSEFSSNFEANASELLEYLEENLYEFSTLWWRPLDMKLSTCAESWRILTFTCIWISDVIENVADVTFLTGCDVIRHDMGERHLMETFSAVVGTIWNVVKIMVQYPNAIQTISSKYYHPNCGRQERVVQPNITGSGNTIWCGWKLEHNSSVAMHVKLKKHFFKICR